jgi:hypothetical protein
MTAGDIGTIVMLAASAFGIWLIVMDLWRRDRRQ